MVDDVLLEGLIGLVDAQARQIQLLERAVEVFEARFRAKSSFAAAADRDLRAPLTVILGVLQTLETTPMDEEQRVEFVGRALGAAGDLAERLDRLAIAPGDPDPVFPRSRTRTVSVLELVEKACVSLRDALPTQRIVLHCDSDAVINTDPPRFVAIVANLLVNAAKQGRGSVVELDARLDDGEFVLDIADRGPGLLDATPEVLFDPVSRPGQSADHARGMSLHLVRMLARSLGGDATAEDRDGGGMVARVQLPQRRAEDVALRSQRATAPA